MSTTSVDKLDLRKGIVLDLKKKLGIKNLIASVVFVLDRSGSMEWLYNNGFCQRAVERILPVGLGFDDNEQVDFYVFHNGFRKLENVTRKNVDGYVNNYVKEGYGSTRYAPVINEIVRIHGNPTSTTKTGGIMGIGGTAVTKVSGTLEHPVFVIFLTDGENDDQDKKPAEEAIRNASHHGIFFQFVGIGRARFEFLQKLDTLGGGFLDNAGFMQIDDLDKLTDEDLYGRLMNEFPQWVPNAKTHQLIK